MSFSFSDHVALLTEFLHRRTTIVEDIERHLLNVQGKDVSRNRNRAYIEHTFGSCFFEAPGLPRHLSNLKGQLRAAHVVDGFEPVLLETHSQRLEPAQLIVRGYDHWDHHRWPGRSGRVAYAQTLYSVFVVRQLEELSLRIWDEGNDHAGDRVQAIQSLLDGLNETTSPNVFVRDAHWLIQTAQGPLTRHLQPYFRIAEQISQSFSDADRLEVHKAGAKLAGGHLRSQLRYRAREARLPIDDPQVTAITRNSNSMDAALLVRDLVPVLDAYKAACVAQDTERRLDLADAILQGVSADPELFLTRLDILAPCTMIEEVFIQRNVDGHAAYTPIARAHLGLLTRYGELIGDLADFLKEDAPKVDPSLRTYSPLAIAYGFCADIFSNMALGTLLSQPSFGLSLEDMFSSVGRPEDKHTRALGWEALPKKEGEREHFEHSAEWAAQMFDRANSAIRARATHKNAANASNLSSGRLFAVSDSPSSESPPIAGLPDGIVRAQDHCVTSDLQRALASGATAFPKSQIASDRREARFLASAESDGRWFGVSKVLLTMCMCQGTDALITNVPASVIDVLRLTCPRLLVVLQGGRPD